MHTIHDAATRQKLIARINALHENSAAQWGKMNVYQAVKHCTVFEEMMLGKRQYKQLLIGRLLGRMALKQVMKDDAPLGKNSPTGPDFRIKETTGDLAADKQRWVALIEQHAGYENHNFVHPFFGKMTREQMGYLAYKHSDHHLRQFNG